jgi:hypothetical protein
MGKFTKQYGSPAKKPWIPRGFPNVPSKEKLIPHTGCQIAACAVGIGAIKFEDFVGTFRPSLRKAAIK